jgi:hypothetical protein
LRQDYPNELKLEPNQPWLQYNFEKEPEKFLLALRNYVYEGMMAADWKLQNNTVRNWYHVPWMHAGAKGRECKRGLTSERTSLPNELGRNQTMLIQNWAVGFYNEPGGYTIGQVWKDPLSQPLPIVNFAPGTVVAKVLFTAATPMIVPELEGSVKWDARIAVDASDRTKGFAIQPVYLLQMDIAVKLGPESKAPSGWIFSTFFYDKRASGNTGWERMSPVGLMFGNDPDYSLEMYRAGEPLSESIIMKNLPDLVKSRLGWANRLNGPVDNSVSSCLSCHATAQWPRISIIASRPEQMESCRQQYWFKNWPAGGLLPERCGGEVKNGSVTLDYSLQLADSIRNFCSLNKQARMCTDTVHHMLLNVPQDPRSELLLER